MAGIQRYEVQVDWNNDGVFAGEYELLRDDAYVVGTINVQQGYNYRNSVHGLLAAGKLTVDLLDPDNVFDAFNSASPLDGNILPERAARLVAIDSSGVVHTLWVGLIDAMEPNRARSETPQTRLTAIGIWGRTANNIDIPIQADVGWRDAILQILEELDIPTSLPESDSSDGVFDFFNVNGPARTALEEIRGTTFGLFYEDAGSGTESDVEFITETTLEASAQPKYVIQLASGGSNEILAESYVQNFGRRSIINRVTIQGRAGVLRAESETVISVNTGLVSTTNIGLLPIGPDLLVNSGDALFHRASSFTAANGNVVYNLIRGSGEDYTYNNLGSPTGTNPDAAIDTAWQNTTDEPGASWLADYGGFNSRPRAINLDDPSTNKFVLWNPWSTNWPFSMPANSGGSGSVNYFIRMKGRLYDFEMIEGSADDSNSIDLYGVRTQRVRALVASASDLSDLADKWLDAYDAPLAIWVITYDATDDETIVNPKFDDRVRLFRGSTIVGDFAVRAVRHQISQGRRCRVTVTLVPATTYVAP